VKRKKTICEKWKFQFLFFAALKPTFIVPSAQNVYYDIHQNVNETIDQVVNETIQAKMDLNVPDKDGNTPLVRGKIIQKSFEYFNY
jgi:hypothetical protein